MSSDRNPLLYRKVELDHKNRHGIQSAQFDITFQAAKAFHHLMDGSAFILHAKCSANVVRKCSRRINPHFFFISVRHRSIVSCVQCLIFINIMNKRFIYFFFLPFYCSWVWFTWSMASSVGGTCWRAEHPTKDGGHTFEINKYIKWGTIF